MRSRRELQSRTQPSGLDGRLNLSLLFSACFFGAWSGYMVVGRVVDGLLRELLGLGTRLPLDVLGLSSWPSQARPSYLVRVLGLVVHNRGVLVQLLLCVGLLACLNCFLK